MLMSSHCLKILNNIFINSISLTNTLLKSLLQVCACMSLTETHCHMILWARGWVLTGNPAQHVLPSCTSLEATCPDISIDPLVSVSMFRSLHISQCPALNLVITKFSQHNFTCVRELIISYHMCHFDTAINLRGQQRNLSDLGPFGVGHRPSTHSLTAFVFFESGIFKSLLSPEVKAASIGPDLCVLPDSRRSER